MVGLRSRFGRGTHIDHSVILGADFYEDASATRTCRRWASAATSCCAASIVDKNARIGDGARLTNERGVDEADGDGYYIRSGIVVVPKGGVIAPGTVV